MKAVSIVWLFALFLPFNAGANTLDFSAFPAGYQGTTQITLSDAVVTSYGDDLYIYSDKSKVCAISSGICEADLEIDFTNEVSDLSFIVHGYDSGDSVVASIFDSLDNVLASVTITTQTFVDFAGYTGISRIYFDDSSTGAGLAFGQISYNVSSVPLPAAVWLFCSGVFGLVGMSRRRKAMAV